MHAMQIRRTLRLAGAVAALAAADPAWAQCTHWNLASDFKVPPSQANPNPDACGAPVWSFLATPQGALARDPSTYHPMNVGQGVAGLSAPGVFAWGATNDFVNGTWLPAIGVNASGQDQTVLPGPSSFVWPAAKVLVHPGSSSLAVIGWKSPVAGVVKLDVSVSKMDPRGNGIGWTVDKTSAAGTTTLSFSATDVAGNAEGSRSVVVFVPKGLPVACAATSVPAGPPPHGTATIQGTLTTTVNGFTRTFPFDVTFAY